MKVERAKMTGARGVTELTIEGEAVVVESRPRRGGMAALRLSTEAGAAMVYADEATADEATDVLMAYARGDEGDLDAAIAALSDARGRGGRALQTDA